MKTIRQWFEELPPGYRERALKNAHPDNASKEVNSLRTALGVGFVWHRTSEGQDFWNAVDNSFLFTDEDLPDLPPEPTEDPVKLRAALDAVRAALPGIECQDDFDRIVGEVLK